MLLEWLNLLVRWVHVIAAIMWVGDSFLFMWLDSHLSAPTKPREGNVQGELWMVHSGGFYEVVKRRSLAKNELPPKLYWFKWESYTTWISGFLLLAVVYWLGGAAYLADQSHPMSHGVGVSISLGLLFAALFVYDTLWRTLGQANAAAAKVVSWGLLVGLVALVTALFPGRAAYLQVGATLGTIMAGNVFFRIIPAQRYMLAQTNAGEPVDTTLGLRAKQRSTHNHYLTLPVLFTMLSNHFPATWGHAHNAVVLLLLMGFGAALKYVMNFRFEKGPLVPALGGAALVAAVVMTSLPSGTSKPEVDYASRPAVPFSVAQGIINARCVSCHAEKPANPSFVVAPKGIRLDTPAFVKAYASNIMQVAVRTHYMPLGNLTGITDDERDQLGAWVAHGAALEGANTTPVLKAEPVAAAAPVVANGETPEAEAKRIFEARCVNCHGAAGKGDGVLAASLNPKPRDYSDRAWQASVTDDHLRKVILEGGPSVGKSPLMPGNADLEDKPAVLDALVAKVRALGR
ncbi:MAG: hypothetical protein RL199_1178 [Pseudomonadota bacterium]|jgi:uncharacterized membrane protein